MFDLKVIQNQDNGKLMLYLAIVAIVTANIFLGILALVFKDGIANNAASLYQQEITLLIPTSGVVVVLQHFVSNLFATKQNQQTTSNVSRETQPPAS